MSHTPVAASASPAAASHPSSSTDSKTSSADRGLFIASKFANYVRFVTGLVSYLPEISSWAGTLKYTPWAAFQLQVEVTFRKRSRRTAAETIRGAIRLLRR